MSFDLLSFQMILAGSTISPIDSCEALVGHMTSPSDVLVSVDVPAVVPMCRLGASVGVLFFVGRGSIPLSGWLLDTVLAWGTL